MTSSFYLHIPFCRQKCPYCKFALTPIFDEAKKRRYLAHMRAEIREFFNESKKGECPIGALAINKIAAKTIYFGGGTPSVLSREEIRSLLDCFEIDHETEISLECNPEDITREYAQMLREVGITRVSLGVQSLDDDCLRAIHRSSREMIFSALDSLHAAGHTNINIDLIIGLPHSRPGETLDSIRLLHDRFSHITHTSVYLLEDEKYPKAWKSVSMSEEEMQDEYIRILGYFEQKGWKHYEISSWARPSDSLMGNGEDEWIGSPMLGGARGGLLSLSPQYLTCRHNQNYWNHTLYRGFGLSASSYDGVTRSEAPSSFAGYYRGDPPLREIIDESEKKIEQIIYGLRTFSLSTHLVASSRLTPLLDGGLIRIEDEKILLTPTGIFRENAILGELISGIK